MGQVNGTSVLQPRKTGSANQKKFRSRFFPEPLDKSPESLHLGVSFVKLGAEKAVKSTQTFDLKN